MSILSFVFSNLEEDRYDDFKTLIKDTFEDLPMYYYRYDICNDAVEVVALNVDHPELDIIYRAQITDSVVLTLSSHSFVMKMMNMLKNDDFNKKLISILKSSNTSVMITGSLMYDYGADEALESMAQTMSSNFEEDFYGNIWRTIVNKSNTNSDNGMMDNSDTLAKFVINIIRKE